jgi:UbiD family decarboxylase
MPENYSHLSPDLRDFISSLDSAGELLRVKEEIDWKYEIGTKTRNIQGASKNAPALLFENITDYPGCSLLTNGLGSYAKFAIALGLDPKTPYRDIVCSFQDRYSHPLAPLIVKHAPVKENIFIGEAVDLLTLPVPWWSPADGGRYVGTWHLNITKDPETGIRNVGIYRMQLLGPKRTAISFSPKSHLANHLSKAEANNESLAMATTIGVNETLIMAGAASPPYGVDEFYIAGGLEKNPVELTKCETVDLEVPASAEIVIEGRVLPKLRIQEGPFLDYSGMPNRDPSACVLEVTSMMFRKRPIFRGAAIGLPGSEDQLLFSLLARSSSLDFHGSQTRQKIQSFFLKKGSYRAFQLVGVFGQLVKKKLLRRSP